MTRAQWTALAALLMVITRWISTTGIAWPGVCGLLLSGVLTWDEVTATKKAWDAIFWIAPLLMIGEQLSKRGVISPTFASCESRVSIVFGALLSGCKAGPGGTGREPLYTHYGFAGMTAHVPPLRYGFRTPSILPRETSHKTCGGWLDSSFRW